MRWLSVCVVVLIGCAGDPAKGLPSSDPPAGLDTPALGDTAPDTLPPDDTGEEGDTGGAVVPVVEPVAHRLGVRDYGFLYWPGSHWTSWGTYDDVQHVLTGYYGLAFDVSTGNLDHFGHVVDEVSAEAALQQGNAAITELSTASVQYAVMASGRVHGAVGFYGVDGTATNPSQLIDMGRFMQRVEVPQVRYGDGGLEGSVELAAMTRHLVLTHRVENPSGDATVGARITISGDAVAQYPDTVWLEGSRAVSVQDSSGSGWSFIIPEREGLQGQVRREADGGLTFESVVDGVAPEVVSLSVIAVPSHAATAEQLAVWLRPASNVSVRYAQLARDGTGGDALMDAVFDPARGVYRVPLSDLSAVGAPGYPDWSVDSHHNWYNRHRLVIDNTSTVPLSVPVAFDGGNNSAFYIVGGSPMLRDAAGEPTGIPVQISKNWHETPFWYHLYSSPLLSPGVHELEHTFAHSRWGEAYAAAHAQLSLIGWGFNQQWDESSLGAFGESVTYDPDLTLGRAQVDDVRPFLVDTSGQWGWTGNVGGASFLVYANADGYQSRPDHQLGRMRTHYAYTGPNLTNVSYAGISRDGRIEARIDTQLGRTDDLIRVYYHLEYTVLDDVEYDRLALFQVAADRYADNGFTRYAYGNAEGVLQQGDISDHRTTGYAADADRGIALPGEAPWVMLYASDRSDGSLPEHLANVGYVVRSYEALIGDTLVTTPHINLIRTYNGGWSQVGMELGLPHDPSSRMVPAGSVLRATVEYLVPPADKGAYYGQSDYLTAMAADDFTDTRMMLELAAGNHLEVVATAGTLLRTWPVELAASAEKVAVQFTLTGGRGYTPVTIHGLARPDGWRLESLVKGAWTLVDQSVEGNDYWQAYDNPSAGGFDLIFNVHNRGTTVYRLTR